MKFRPKKKLEKEKFCICPHFFSMHQKQILCFLATKSRKLNWYIYFLPATNQQLLMKTKKKKSQVIFDYNANKKGVDTADEMLRTYSTKAASRSWPLVTFFNLLNITALITYIIYANISISICTRHTFLIKLGKSLCSAEKSRRQKTPHLLRLK